MDYSYFKNKYFCFFSILTISVSTIFILINPTFMDNDSLYWFFSATSQSMAALIAVVGMFAVFRIQAQENRLQKEYDILKGKFSSEGWRDFLGPTGSQYWGDDEILVMAEKWLEIAVKREILQEMIDEIKKRINILKKTKNIKNKLVKSLKIPLFSVALTFILSIFLLPFSSFIGSEISKIIILNLILVFIVFSITSIVRYINYCFSDVEK